MVFISRNGRSMKKLVSRDDVEGRASSERIPTAYRARTTARARLTRPRGPLPLPLSISPRLHLLLLRPPQMTGDDERERERHERRGVTELGQWGEEGRVRCPYLKKKLRFPLLNHRRAIGLDSFHA